MTEYRATITRLHPMAQASGGFPVVAPGPKWEYVSMSSAVTENLSGASILVVLWKRKCREDL